MFYTLAFSRCVRQPAGDREVDEGAIAHFSIPATDPGNDQLTYSWNFGDDSEVVTGQAPTHVFTQNGNYTVVATVTDEDGATTTSTMSVKVNNVAPTIIKLTGDHSVKDGDSAQFSALATDPGDDNLTYTWDFDDDSETITGENVTHTFANNGNYSVELTVSDRDGASTSQTLNVQVVNVAPTIHELKGDTEINEGDNATFSANTSDPGSETW